MKKEKTLTFKDLTRMEEPKTERLSEADLVNLENERLKQENEQLWQERDLVLRSFRRFSHDMRAPVRALAQLSEWIIQDCEGQLPGDAEENLEMLKVRARRLDRMHQDFSYYVRCSQLIEEVDSEVSLRALVNKVWQAVSKEMSTDGFEFAMDLDEHSECIMSQPNVLEAILTQLLKNSVHHHDRDEGFVSMTARCQHNLLTIVVDDDGPGIPVHMHEQALTPMKTLRARDNGAGTGVGLAIVDRLVNLLGGTMHMEYTFASTSRGLRVSCQLPINSPLA